MNNMRVQTNQHCFDLIEAKEDIEKSLNRFDRFFNEEVLGKGKLIWIMS